MSRTKTKFILGIWYFWYWVGILQFVDDRTRNTLLIIIEKNVLPGSEIQSDCWGAYNAISAIPIIPPFHKTVNHSQNFIDPITGACTNSVEGFWKNAKQKFKQLSGTTPDILPSHLDEFVWRVIKWEKNFRCF